MKTGVRRKDRTLSKITSVGRPWNTAQGIIGVSLARIIAQARYWLTVKCLRKESVPLFSEQLLCPAYEVFVKFHCYSDMGNTPLHPSHDHRGGGDKAHSATILQIYKKNSAKHPLHEL